MSSSGPRMAAKRTIPAAGSGDGDEHENRENLCERAPAESEGGAKAVHPQRPDGTESASARPVVVLISDVEYLALRLCQFDALRKMSDSWPRLGASLRRRASASTIASRMSSNCSSLFRCTTTERPSIAASMPRALEGLYNLVAAVVHVDVEGLGLLGELGDGTLLDDLGRPR